jgi:ribonuclease G
MRDVANESKAEALLIQMNPRVSAEFTRDDARVLRAVEQDTGKVFVFEGSEGLPLDHFSVVLEGSRNEVLDRAVPFRVGEEVHVEIVEPHMYSPGDAVAKVDGYVISVTGGGPYVGEKHLVRIEEAGRTAAMATLLDASPDTGSDAVSTAASGGRRARRAPSRDGSKPESASAASKSDSASAGSKPDSASARSEAAAGEEAAEDGLQSKPRRRGRRGGRRRSGAKAESASATSSSSD